MLVCRLADGRPHGRLLAWNASGSRRGSTTLEPNQPSQDQDRDRSDLREPESGRRTAARASLAVGCVSLVVGFFAFAWFFLTAIMFMDNPGAALPFVRAIEALFAVGVGSLLLGCLLWYSSKAEPR